MKTSLIAACGSLVVLLAHAALADDVLPPDWRSDPPHQRTITAGWDSWGQPGIGPGQIVLFGNSITSTPPDAFGGETVVGYAQWNSSVVVLDSYQEAQSVLEVNPGGGLGPVSFSLINFPDLDNWKQIRIQITQLGSGVLDFYVGSGYSPPNDLPWPNPDSMTKIDAIVADAYQQNDGWVTRAYDLRIGPNPFWESITLDWGYNTGPQTWVAWIDQVVIDTWCIPEPSTSLLLGGMLVLQLRCVRK